MDGRRPKGMVIEQARCDDESKRPAFEKWYGEHLAKAKAAGLATNTRLYRNIREGELRPGTPGYMALYELPEADPGATGTPAFKWDSAIKGASLLQQTATARPPAPRGPKYLPNWGSWETAGTTGKLAVEGVIVVQCVYPDEPRWQQALNRWYNDHVRWVVSNGANHTSYRYVDVEPEPDGIRVHWAFYESSLPNFKAEMARIVAEGRARQKQAPTTGRDFFPHYAKMLSNVTYEAIA